MRRSLLVLLAAATLPLPAHAACPPVTDRAGDATVSDDALMSGMFDPDVPAPALDLVQARASVGSRSTTFAVRVVDLASAATDSPSGIGYSWEVSTSGRAVFVLAWSTVQGSGVVVYAGPTIRESTFVARLAGPRIDTAADTVTFEVPSSTLGLRQGAPSDSVVRSWREVTVDTPVRKLSQSSAADSAADDGRPAWGRC